MKELEEDFFSGLISDVNKTKHIANFQSEIPRDSENAAMIDYVADNTDSGFVVKKEKAEQINKEIVQAADEFIDQKVDDILGETFSKWKES